ncbi:MULTISPECIES: hormogonium polysaccharide biosynthesis protein HpsA [unclassified Microcoleus]|uniref:hormogonium polysaccharide biosynthesis protein HpsA n=1 Tax=unclassified Microcoleus TaxID=2642155 RepID=UPI0025E829D5|nr:MULTISPECIES: hormogonium polysaccharide biosynthesis protein HpsA [unclassified Microcoleus]
MFKSKLSKVIVSLLRRIAGVTRSGAKRLMRAMLQALMAMGRRAKLPVAGFVLPTVTMVLLVVILLTVAIVLRSFDRANLARNVRVNQQVLAAATPALDRAKAKIQFMLREDPQRPTATPSDAELYRIMSFDGKSKSGGAAQPDLYTFGDEERLILRADLNSDGKPDPNADPKGALVIAGADNEALNTAWRYPVDTNNNGLVDTYTLYGIYFRTPQRDATGNFARARKPLEARTPPMSITGLLRPECVAAAGTSASLVGDSGWYKLDGRLKKSFFVYTVNVPITETNRPPNGEVFTGTPSLSALEYQQDQSRIPLSNNAVVYEDDLDISPALKLNLNGRIITNSNLLISSLSGANDIKLHLVSSEKSCFYDQENSKIVVSGNVVSGNAGSGIPLAAEVHLFKKTGLPDKSKVIDDTNQSVTNNSLQVLYNNNAYANRIALLVASRIAAEPNNDPNTNTDPLSVKQAMRPPLSQTREQALQAYFKERTRKVPFAEADLRTSGLDTYSATNPPIAPGATGDDLRPVNEWSLPTGGTATAATTDGPKTKLTINPTQLQATNPIKPSPPEEETFLGDRVVAGNNLPAQRWDESSKKFLGSDTPQTVDGTTAWDGGDKTPRTRRPQITQIADIGAIDRDGFWEKAAAQIPKTAVDGIGGLRVVTSAGVYERLNSFLPLPRWDDPTTSTVEGSLTYDDPATTGPEKLPIVWPDSMPMSPVLGAQLVYNNGRADTVAPSGWAIAPLPNPEAPATPTPLPAPQAPTIDPNTPKYAKGDLRMRATAVYHYAQGGGYDPTVEPTNLDNVRPIACISSYYDPSTAVTARNISTLPNVSGLLPSELEKLASGTLSTRPQPTTVGSNNGVVYPPPADRTKDGAVVPDADGLLGSGDLQTQANYVFPDGRFANEPLRNALLKDPTKRNLADKAAIDSTMCALEILKNPASKANVAGIPDGAIQEVAFLNAREVKAIERDDLNTRVDETFTLSSPLSPAAGPRNPQSAWLKGNYNLALEDREPLEIRATQLNIAQLRTTSIGSSPTGPNPEWLLPSSGIVFASRDDALPDRSNRTPSTTTPGIIDENTSKLVSPTDSLLDPTRKPNGILLVEGSRLFRGTTPTTKTVTDVVKEKGLTLVSNLPVYIKGNFNLHGRTDETTKNFTEVEEFDELLTKATSSTDSGWGNFYTRTTLSKNFACRNGDPRLTCGGDFWRQANVLADAVTVLSDNYRFGFRNEGDFDLRNNAGGAVIPRDADGNGTIAETEIQTLKRARLDNGFFTNNFVTNGLTSGAFNANGSGLIPPNAPAGVARLLDSDYVGVPPATPKPDEVRDSSYFNNFVTPVQRRGLFPQYLMEVCVKLPVAACGPKDWYINPPSTATPAGVKASNTSLSLNQTYQPSISLTDTINFKAGTTVDPPVPELQRFPRRIAFLRDANDQLLSASPQPLGIKDGTVAPGAGTPKANSLWFAAANGAVLSYKNNTGETPYLVNNNTTDGNGTTLPPLAANSKVQPLLLPVLQIQTVRDVAAVRDETPLPQSGGDPDGVKKSRWMPRAINTTQNLIVGAGDTPSRALSISAPLSGDFNGGLQNFPRFVENWNIPGSPSTNNIKGSFIQLNRSAYSTAPYVPILAAPPPDVPAAVAPNLQNSIQSLFFAASLPPNTIPTARYRTDNNGGRIPFFTPPLRNWGYDVGMLSQSPDLFTQRFTTPPTKTQPAEYFREVPRNDEWINTLMCGKTVAGANAVGDNYRTECPPASP